MKKITKEQFDHLQVVHQYVVRKLVQTGKWKIVEHALPEKSLEVRRST